MSIKSARQKGKDLEDYVADQIVEFGLDPKARREGSSGAGNREKGDVQTNMMVLGQNAGIECKNWKVVAIPEWWRQTKKLEGLGREPILVYKLPGDPYEGTLVTIYLDTFLHLVKAAGPRERLDNIHVSDAQADRDKKYAVENLKQAIARVQKAFE